MKGHLIFICVLIFILYPSANAQKITLKHSFWSGWKYSTDGESFENVGVSAKPLREIMSNNDECLKKLNAYKADNIVAIILAIPTLALLTINVIELTDSDGKDPDTGMEILMYAVGGAGIGANAAADNNLKRAVEIYNESPPGVNLKFGLKTINSNRKIVIGFQLACNFN